MMNILNDTNVNIIFWKKEDASGPLGYAGTKYYCYVSNCGIKEKVSLKSYLKTIDYGEYYDNLITTKENQIIKQISCNILLQMLDNNIILEVRTHISSTIQLLYTISHRIRVPLTNISSILMLTESRKDSKKNNEILKSSCSEIMDVVNDILDIINLSRGELKLDLSRTSLSGILKQCYDIAIKETREKKVNLNFYINKNVPDYVNIDATKIKQILINLLNNAIQNTNNGGIIVEVTLFDKPNDVGYPFTFTETKHPQYNILFSVKDTGIGIDNISMRYIESILEINKEYVVSSYKYGGLGLILSKNICNLMNGHIWFKSEHNIGTIFYFNVLC